MAASIFLIFRFLFVQIFLYSMLSKSVNHAKFSSKTLLLPFTQFRVSPGFVLLQELLVIALLFTDSAVPWGGLYGAVLLTLYTLYLYETPATDSGAACECFAIKEIVKINLSKRSRLLLNTTLIVAFLVFSYFGFINGSQMAIAQENMPWLTHAFKFNLLALSFIFALQVLLLDHYKGLKKELAGLDSFLADRGIKPPPSGINIDKDISGKPLINKDFDEVLLESVLEKNKGTVIVYLKEGCHHCKDILQSLPAYIEESQNPSGVMFIYGGQPRPFLELCHETKMENIYLDKADNIRSSLRFYGFPSAFYINEAHLVFSDFAVGFVETKELLDYIQQGHATPWLKNTKAF
ncbi:MAG: hypothetical protein LBV29_09220 [Azoarcus sp.]|jgi:hypothetical protein|nr:hypothetical protein [Azoarcus sp.]